MASDKKVKPFGYEKESKTLNVVQNNLIFEFLEIFDGAVGLKDLRFALESNIRRVVWASGKLDKNSTRKLICKEAEEVKKNWLILLNKQKSGLAQSEWEGLRIKLTKYLYADDKEVLAALTGIIDENNKLQVKVFAEKYYESLQDFWELFEINGVSTIQIIKAEHQCKQKMLAMSLADILDHDLVMDMVFSLARELFPEIYAEAINYYEYYDFNPTE